ncbi:MAG: PAS domain S-box protein [Candidatus Thermoplasmatota archaeon]|nr:PAS domain S-box protein [Candidatus Thermoplasmatota archaeon]
MSGEEEEGKDVSVITSDLEGIVQSYSEGAAKLFGWDSEEVVGKQSVAIFHQPEAVEELVPRLLKQAAEEGLFEEEVVFVKKDGTEFKARLSVRPVYREGKIVGYMGRTVVV